MERSLLQRIEQYSINERIIMLNAASEYLGDDEKFVNALNDWMDEHEPQSLVFKEMFPTLLSKREFQAISISSQPLEAVLPRGWQN
jgi:hypothetical protein